MKPNPEKVFIAYWATDNVLTPILQFPFHLKEYFVVSRRQLHPCAGTGSLEEVFPACLEELLAKKSTSVIRQLT